LDFKVEFINPVGETSEYSSVSYNNRFVGSNVFIEEADNVLSGSLFVGDGIGSGVEISGIGGAYIRSVGYTG